MQKVPKKTWSYEDGFGKCGFFLQLPKSILTVASGLSLFFPYKKGEAIGYLQLFVAHEISGVMNDHDSNPKNATV